MQINKNSTLLRMECINIPHEKNTYTFMNRLELLLFGKKCSSATLLLFATMVKILIHRVSFRCSLTNYYYYYYYMSWIPHLIKMCICQHSETCFLLVCALLMSSYSKKDARKQTVLENCEGWASPIVNENRHILSSLWKKKLYTLIKLFVLFVAMVGVLVHYFQEECICNDILMWFNRQV